MHFFNPKTLFVFALATMLLALNAPAQVVNTQSFDATTFLPTGWSGVGTVTSWSRRTTNNNPTITPHSGAGMARFAARTAPLGTTQTIATPPVDYSNRGNNPATVSLWLFRDTTRATVADSISIFINNSAILTGATELGAIARSTSINLPDTVSAPGWQQYTFSVPAGFTTDSNYILIEGTAQSGNNIFIDDISWVSYPNPCVATPSAGSMVPVNALICNGTGATTINLSGATTGLSGLSYIWYSAATSSGPFTVIDTAVTAINTGTITATTYYKCVVSCAYASGADSSSATVAVTAQPNPTVTVSPTTATICAGSNTAVSLVASGAVTYTWSPANGLNGTLGDSVRAQPTNTTRYTVTGTDSVGCSATASANVSVRNAPVAGATASAGTICAGDSVVLNDTTSAFGNITFLWAPGGYTTQSITVMPDTTTTYSVTATGGSGCSSNSSVTVVVATTVANFGSIGNGTTVTFIDSSVNAAGYIWSFGDADTSTLQNPVHVYMAAGTYSVTLIAVSAACTNDTITKVITVYPAGINAINGVSGLSIWPNPAAAIAHVSFTGLAATAKLDVVNELGQTVYSRVATPKAGQQYQEDLNLEGLAAGVYIVKVICGQGMQSYKITRF